jgi:hypothetical protein
MELSVSISLAKRFVVPFLNELFDTNPILEFHTSRQGEGVHIRSRNWEGHDCSLVEKSLGRSGQDSVHGSPLTYLIADRSESD